IGRALFADSMAHRSMLAMRYSGRMATQSLQFVSRLDAAVEEVWAAVSTMAGVNYELAPLIKMSFPHAATGLSIEAAPLGVTAFHSYLLVFGVLPFDRHALTLLAVQPNAGFIEDSTSLLQKRWRHERRIERSPEGGCVVTDELLFVPRIAFMEPLVRRIVR